jgi:hypothetical protein
MVAFALVSSSLISLSLSMNEARLYGGTAYTHNHAQLAQQTKNERRAGLTNNCQLCIFILNYKLTHLALYRLESAIGLTTTVIIILYVPNPLQ